MSSTGVYYTVFMYGPTPRRVNDRIIIYIGAHIAYMYDIYERVIY